MGGPLYMNQLDESKRIRQGGKGSQGSFLTIKEFRNKNFHLSETNILMLFFVLNISN